MNSSSSGAGSHHGGGVNSLDHTPEHTLLGVVPVRSEGISNGEIKVLSDSSGVNSAEDTPPTSITSFEEKVYPN